MGFRQVWLEQVWRLDLATLRWEAIPALMDARSHPACCAVRGVSPSSAGYHQNMQTFWNVEGTPRSRASLPWHAARQRAQLQS